jgi:hypothetical protein
MTRERRSATAGLLLAACVWAAGARAAHAQPDVERVRTAKTLFFDRKYAEARTAWDAVRAAKGPDAEAATYWIARCSENLGENDRALKEYDAFLALKPQDRTLTEEARTSRVGLAAKLYKAGGKQHAAVLRNALADPSKTVRYYDALQMSALDADMCQAAAPVLRQILEKEKDADLVDRAKLGLLRCDPSALGPVARGAAPSIAAPHGSAGHETRMVHIRITEKAGTRPKVSINLPFALAEMLYKALPEDAKANLTRKGYDAATFWDSLRKLGPSEILSVEGDEGERIEIWTE